MSASFSTLLHSLTNRILNAVKFAMSVHTMTPIREEVESTMSANADTHALKEEADVNINKAANTTVPVSKEEEVKTSSSASTIVPFYEEEEEDVDSGIITIGYFFKVPCVKWHPEIEMMSKSGLTQGQYERKVLAQGYVDHSFRLSVTAFPIYTSSRLRVELMMPKRQAPPLFHCHAALPDPCGVAYLCLFKHCLFTSCHPFSGLLLVMDDIGRATVLPTNCEATTEP